MTAGELAVQLRRRQRWLVLGLVALVPGLLTAVIGAAQPAAAERIGDFGSVITNRSGLTMPLIALSAMLLFLLPLAVAVFAGEAVAVDAGWGRLRYLLARPVPRWRLLASKAAVAAGFSVTAVAVAAAAALLAGVVAFGWHPLTVVDLERTTAFHVATVTLAPAEAAARLGLAVLVIACALSSTFAFALFLSTLTRSPFAALAGGVGLGVVSRALDNVPGLDALGPWLPVTDAGTTAWVGLFLGGSGTAGIGHLALVQALYTAAFLAAAWVRFTRADVLA